MDKSDEYIEMCKKLIPLQNYKYKIGFKEEDYIYDGKKARILAYDFLGLKTIYESKIENLGHYKILRFAMLKYPKLFLYTNEYSKIINLKQEYGEYEIFEIANAIWMPTQHQIQELYKDIFENNIYGYTLISRLNEFIVSLIKNINTCTIVYKDLSMEKLWLMFYVYEKYDLYWNTNEKFWRRKINE